MEKLNIKCPACKDMFTLSSLDLIDVGYKLALKEIEIKLAEMASPNSKPVSASFKQNGGSNANKL